MKMSLRLSCSWSCNGHALPLIFARAHVKKPRGPGSTHDSEITHIARGGCRNWFHPESESEF